MRQDLPSGTVTFLFTDVEGSTRLLHSLGAEAYADALADHRRVIREACAVEGGVEVDTQGDAFFIAFPTAPGALAAAAAFTQSLTSGPIAVRVGLHTGTPLLTEEGYIGGDVHRAARIAACGHGGQVLVSASTAQLVERELRDLGEHRLKDLSAPERIYQLGEGDFPALKSLYRTNLPVPATPFLGREQELAEVVELLSGDNARLLTLTGPGGTGKTRLALQAAGMASDAYPDGVWWIPLAPLRDATLVLPTAGRLLGSKNGLAEHIQDKAMLCLFDNFEQVVEAAPELAALVGACPNLDVLVTSRERLRVGGEQTYPVPPLVESDGEALFLMRARAVDPGFVPGEAMRELCLRLDELPLALELAAARTALFSPEQLLAKLSQRLDLLKGERDADPRQQTLRATIEWSYDLLSEDEQLLFARLAVFAGGCTYEAAEEIAGADPDTLQSLLDKSLLRKRDSKGGLRYWMLETIREYAAERLAMSGEADELRRKHADWFLALAEEAEPHLRGDPTTWLERLETEHDNMRSALDALDDHDEAELALRLAWSLQRFWMIRGHLAEGRRRMERALANSTDDSIERGKALSGLAVLTIMQRDYESTAALVEESRLLHRRLGDELGVATSEFHLALLANDSADWPTARELFEASVERFAELGDEYFELVAQQNLAWVTYECGDHARAYELHFDTLRRSRELSIARLEAEALSALASRAMDEARVDDAKTLLRDGLALHYEIGEVSEVALDVVRVARAAAAEHRPELAARLLARADRAYEEHGISPPPWADVEHEKALAEIRPRLDDSESAEWTARGRELTLDDAVALALEFLDEDSTIVSG